MPNELDVFICGFMLFGIVAAVGGESAVGTMRGAGLADIAAVEKQPMVRLGDEVGGDIARQLVLGLAWRLAVGGQSEAFRDAEDMRIHRIVGWFHITAHTTLAVLRPTPGKVCKSSILSGT